MVDDSGKLPDEQENSVFYYNDRDAFVKLTKVILSEAGYVVDPETPDWDRNEENCWMQYCNRFGARYSSFPDITIQPPDIRKRFADNEHKVQSNYQRQHFGFKVRNIMPGSDKDLEAEKRQGRGNSKVAEGKDPEMNYAAMPGYNVETGEKTKKQLESVNPKPNQNQDTTVLMATQQSKLPPDIIHHDVDQFGKIVPAKEELTKEQVANLNTTNVDSSNPGVNINKPMKEEEISKLPDDVKENLSENVKVDKMSPDDKKAPLSKDVSASNPPKSDQPSDKDKKDNKPNPSKDDKQLVTR